MNQCTITGNLGADPELRTVGQDNSVCELRVAVNDRVKKRGEWQAQTTWFRCTVWGKTAENCAKYLSKGRKVLVTGRVQMSEWTDKEGAQRSTLELADCRVEFIGGREDGGGAQRSSGGGTSSGGGSSFDDGEIPF